MLSNAVRIGLWLNATKSCYDHKPAAYTWPMNSTDAAPHDHPYLESSVYYGALGPAVFFQQLSATRPTPEANKWRELANGALEGARLAISRDLPKYGANGGFYYGLAGVAYGLRAAGHDQQTYEQAAANIEAIILTRIAPFANSSTATLWNNTDIAHGAAGTGLYFLWLSRRAEPANLRAAALDAALRAGSWLLTRAESIGSGGLRWARGPDTDGEHEHSYYPTFCCGGAGVSYFLSELARECASVQPEASAAFLDAARRGAEHVLALAQPLNKEGLQEGLLVPHEEQGAGLGLFYLGWCGGPPGWARLFVSLHRSTRESRWLDYLAQATRALERLVTPEKGLPMLWPVPPSSPPWDNLGQCCGASAAGQYLLAVGEAAPDALPLDPQLKRSALAAGLQIADAIAARGVPAVPDGLGLAIPSPEEHDAPLDTRWQAGWMQGAAGVASFLLHAQAVREGNQTGRRVPWPDEPW